MKGRKRAGGGGNAGRRVRGKEGGTRMRMETERLIQFD